MLNMLGNGIKKINTHSKRHSCKNFRWLSEVETKKVQRKSFLGFDSAQPAKRLNFL